VTDLPKTVSRAAAREALESLGIPWKHLRSVYLQPKSLTVTQWRVDEDGKVVIAGDERATITTVVAFTD
jgi:hypothetical protein